MSRMGWEQTTRLESTLVKSQDRVAAPPDMLPAERMSFMQTSDPAVFLSAWKHAEDGAGTVLRFIELTGGARREVRVASPLFGGAAVRTCNAVEDCAERPSAASAAGGFTFEAGPRQIQTFKLQGSRR
jgi:alpha-mannosidase